MLNCSYLLWMYLELIVLKIKQQKHAQMRPLLGKFLPSFNLRSSCNDELHRSGVTKTSLSIMK